MPRFIKRVLSSWGNFPREEGFDFRPDNSQEVAEILSEKLAPHFIPRGLGRSYGDASLNAGGGVIRNDRLNRFLSWNPENALVECEAGVTFEDLLNVFLPKGYFPPVTPGTKFVTLGGAIAADVHGKNHHRDGSIATFLESFTLLDAMGEVLTCSRQENPELFWATIGGMGLTGMILTLKLKLQPVQSAYITVNYQKLANLDDALKAFTSDQDFRYSVAWIDCLAKGSALGRSVLMRGDHTPVRNLPSKFLEKPLVIRRKRTKSVPFQFPGFVLNSFTVRWFNRLYYFRHGNREKIVDYDTFFYPLDSVLNWNRIYGKRGFIQYQVALPPEGSRQGLLELLEQLARSGMASFLAVLKTFGPANEGLLSFPRAGATLALDIPYKGKKTLEFLVGLDNIVLKHGGRVYLAKDARLPKDTFEAMYPNIQHFRKIKKDIDPKNLFSSSLARRLGLA